MYRKIIEKLISWSNDANKKPIILRGARQVGKTWVVRALAEKLGLDLVELNFERNATLLSLFKGNDPNKIILHLEASFNKKISAESSLIFLDEVQAAPELLAKLRWFAEEMPTMRIIATGSLLDFALEEHEFSMPVGRVSYLYLEPMSFTEFLLAAGQDKLCEFINNYKLPETIPMAIHERLMHFLREYIYVGGMPACVACWINKHSLADLSEIQHNIIQSYRDDFAKYAKRTPLERLDDIFRAVPNLLGKKFKYSAVNSNARSEVLKKALNLLCKARICHKVICTAGNGTPLHAAIKEDMFKVIFLDIGLVSAALNLSYASLENLEKTSLINEGGLAEQFVGQQLRLLNPSYIDPKLYYWQREKRGAEAEIDYVIAYKDQVIPIEVNAGTTGTLRSLHSFMKEKHLQTAIRFNADLPSAIDVKVRDAFGDQIEYKLISLPLYLVTSSIVGVRSCPVP